MPRGRKGTGLTQKEKGNIETRSYSLELRMDALRAELAHVQGLVNVLRAEREMWRARGLQARARDNRRRGGRGNEGHPARPPPRPGAPPPRHTPLPPPP